MIAIVIVAVAVLAIAAFVWLTYNRMVAKRQATESSWAQIDVALRRRHDLIPVLVESVKGYAAHERTTFENVTEARSEAIAAEGPRRQAAAEGTLGRATDRVLVVAEAYPELEASAQLLPAAGRPARGRGPDRDHPPRLQRHGRDLQHPDPGLPGGDRRPPVRLRATRVLRRPGRGRGGARRSASPRTRRRDRQALDRGARRARGGARRSPRPPPPTAPTSPTPTSPCGWRRTATCW